MDSYCIEKASQLEVFMQAGFHVNFDGDEKNSLALGLGFVNWESMDHLGLEVPKPLATMNVKEARMALIGLYGINQYYN